MKIKDILLGWDFIASLLMSILLFIILPSQLENIKVISYYEIGITVLSIVFSIYFASLAIIIATPDNDFIKFLELDGAYTALISLFKFTLYSLFIGLVYSIFAFAITSYFKDDGGTQCKLFLSLFSFVFFYGLFCTVNSTKHSITYSIFRTRYLKENKKKND